MATPFRIKKGDTWSPWKAVINGKTVELASAESTQEDASKALANLMPPVVSQSSKKSTVLDGLLPNLGKTPDEESSTSTGSKTTTSPIEKPKTGELRKEGLSELSTAKVEKFRKIIASALASGNVSLDRALVSIFRDKVPVLSGEQYLLLSTGWELACEQYFVNGVPPAWVIILLGNVMVTTALYEKSEAKPQEELPKIDRTIGNPPNRT